ncbi:MAG TPA: glycosyltransferase family 4 protein [Methylotenera sp.]|nr:glycosyltransferase family 4 protein [Methylotenera sp.]
MNVLIVSQYFWPESFRINDIAKSMQLKGIGVEVLTGKPNYPAGDIYDGYKAWGCQQEQFESITLHRIPLIPRGKRTFLLALNYLSFIFFGLLLAPWKLRKQRYDAIFVYGISPILQAIPALLIGWIKGVPVVIWVQDLWPQSLSATGYIHNSLVLNLVEKVVRFIYRKADLLLVQSRAFEEPVTTMSSGTPVLYYPNAADDVLAQTSETSSNPIAGLDEGFSVMFAGNIGKAQAVEVIVEAATILRDHQDIHFVVLGDGSCRDMMLKEVEARGLTNLHLPGRFPVESMPGFMQKASALLVTLANQTIFAATVPNKIQAYMAAGRPILACLDGEGARLVNEANAGLCVPAEDAVALAKAVIELYKMPEEGRDQLGANGRQYYKENFNHDKLVDDLIVKLQLASRQYKGE